MRNLQRTAESSAKLVIAQCAYAWSKVTSRVQRVVPKELPSIPMIDICARLAHDVYARPGSESLRPCIRPRLHFHFVYRLRRREHWDSVKYNLRIGKTIECINIAPLPLAENRRIYRSPRRRKIV